MNQEADRSPSRGRAFASIAAILLLGAMLRLWGLSSFPYQEDELYTVIEARELFDSPLQPGIETRPLYYLMQHVLLDVAPLTPAGLRAPALLFGLLGIWVTWRLGVLAVGGAGGWIAALLVALSPWHMHASGMARYWSLVYALAALFCLIFLRATRTGRAPTYLAALLVLLTGWLTHPTFVLPLPGYAIATCVVADGSRWRWQWPGRNAVQYLWLPFALVAIALWLTLVLTGNEESIRNFGGRGSEANLRLVPGLVQWLSPPIVVGYVLGALALMLGRSAVRHWAGSMALFGGGSTVALALTASTFTDVYVDYWTAALPLVFISVAGLVQVGAERLESGRALFVTITLAVFAAATLPSAASHLSDGTRFDYRPALEEILRTAPEVPVVVRPLAIQREYAPELEGHSLPMDPVVLERMLVREEDLWLIASVRRRGIVGDPSHAADRWLTERCRRVRSDERLRLDYRRYRVDLYRCREG